MTNRRHKALVYGWGLLLLCLLPAWGMALTPAAMDTIEQRASAQVKPYQAYTQDLQQRAHQQQAVQFYQRFIARQAGRSQAHEKGYHYPRVLVFVSFSLPDKALRQWLHQANRWHADLVLRGLVNNSFKATAVRIKRVLQHSKGGFQVAPNLFEQFGVTKVPAVVVIPEGVRLCHGKVASCRGKTPFDMVYGNVPLTVSLKHIAERGTVAKATAKRILQHPPTEARYV